MMLNRVILGLGTNYDKERNIAAANRLLSDYFPDIRFSDAVYTEPIGMENAESFLNQVAIASVSEEREVVKRIFKQIERQLGRTAADKVRGIIAIDIDLLQWNEEILKSEDLCREYVRDGILQLLSDEAQIS